LLAGESLRLLLGPAAVLVAADRSGVDGAAGVVALGVGIVKTEPTAVVSFVASTAAGVTLSKAADLAGPSTMVPGWLLSDVDVFVEGLTEVGGPCSRGAWLSCFSPSLGFSVGASSIS